MYGEFEYSEEFKDLVLNMMSYNHKNRPTLEEIRNHPWMSMGEDKIETPKKREKADGLKREASMADHTGQMSSFAVTLPS